MNKRTKLITAGAAVLAAAVAAPLAARAAQQPLRDGITGLIRELDESAAVTRPSRKSEIETELAVALRRLLEAP